MVTSKRNFASSNRPRKVSTRSRPTCSQTETSSLSAPNDSVARVYVDNEIDSAGLEGLDGMKVDTSSLKWIASSSPTFTA